MAKDPSSPSQNPNPIFKDITNFKTPKRNPNLHSPLPTFKTPKPLLPSPHPHFFTASKHTPSSSFRRRSSFAPPSKSKSKAARRLKAFELEQSQSSRKAQLSKQKSLESLANALTVWLNFLFENPKACGCDGREEGRSELGNGKRESLEGGGVGIDGPWRSAKRSRDCEWRAEGSVDKEPLVLASSAFSSLRASLKEVCSFDDLKQRMSGYLSAEGCKEVFSVMTKLTKNIDEGRFKMKAHCPIVTDLRLKEQAVRVLMCYNPTWLRVGFYIVFGGNSLLPVGDVSSDQDLCFLKMIVEKQLFSHSDLAKMYAYNKSVEGLYRPGYYEALGNVILKRFLMLVLILDRAKSQSSLPINYGIDGIDGGSPLLFDRESNIKSSRQVIHDFLSSEVMHGEGDLLAHLVIVGYKVSYEQYPLLDYEFKVKNIFDDLQDGVLLCRAIQLLKCDTSILVKMAVPSDTHKKNLANCSVVLQYLKEAGVPLSDEDGFIMVAEDIVSGEKELTLAMLWKMFVHLQVPLLVNKELLLEEICKLNGADMDHLMNKNSNLLEMVLQWIQAICLKYDLKIANYAELLDGKAMRCLVDYYFQCKLHCLSSCKAQNAGCGEPSFWTTDCSDAVHNFILSQKLTTMLGNFPEVLQTSDILEHKGACNERSVIVLLVFLSSQLIGRKNMDHVKVHKLLGCNCPSPEVKRLSLHKCFLSTEPPEKHDGLDEFLDEDPVKKFRLIQTWWRDMVKHHYSKQTSPVQSCSAIKDDMETERERASKIIQAQFRGMIARHKFLKIKTATSVLQPVFRAWLAAKKAKASNTFNFLISKLLSLENQQNQYALGRHLMFMVQRHYFVTLRKCVVLIQHSARIWINKKRRHDCKSDLEVLALSGHDIVPQSRESEIVHKPEEVRNFKLSKIVTLVLAWRKWRNRIIRKRIAAIKIQSHVRAWSMRRNFLHQKKATVIIQCAIRFLRCRREFKQYKIANKSAIIIQSSFRGLVCRKEANKERHLVVMLQSQWRGSLVRREYLYQREAAIAIQSNLRSLKSYEEFHSLRLAAIEVQRFVRGQLARSRLLGASFYRSNSCIGLSSFGYITSFELKIFVYSIKKLQRWWKRVLVLKLKAKATITIQSYIRGWLASREACREKHRIVVIQSYWKGYLARKESKGQLVDLRLRLQRSLSNVDDGMRLINRLVSALSELLNTRSISSILHTCKTLDMATTHSQKCCETIVAAGAVETLLKLIRSLSRSIPDQEVLNHALSTLRNISYYPHLADVVIDTKGSIETILREMLRNKEESYFIASHLLKRLCSTKKGVDAVRNMPALIKRLYNHVNDLSRRVSLEKRKARPLTTKECNEKRFREASDLWRLIANC